MLKKPIKILGINPGTRHLGIACFEGNDLLDWGVKVVKGRWSRQKMKKIIGIVSGLIERHQPVALAVKKLHPARTSRNLSQLVAEITRLARNKRLRLRLYSISELEAFYCPDEKINRYKLAEQVAAAYPVLCHELNQEKGIKNPYHLRMFEAVALAALCFHQLDR